MTGERRDAKGPYARVFAREFRGGNDAYEEPLELELRLVPEEVTA
jgi:adenylylsulfate kinase-like enzyme